MAPASGDSGRAETEVEAAVSDPDRTGVSPMIGWMATVLIGAVALVGGYRVGLWLDGRQSGGAANSGQAVATTAGGAAQIQGVDRFATASPSESGRKPAPLGVRVALGEPAPDFSLPTPDGEVLIALSDFVGQPVLVNFWATWCPPCRHEMPFLQRQYESRSHDGLVVLAVDVSEEPLVVSNYLRGTDLTFPVVLDLFGDIADYYRIVTFPTTYLIDRQGRIAAVKHGAYSSEAEVARAVDALIAVPEG